MMTMTGDGTSSSSHQQPPHNDDCCSGEEEIPPQPRTTESVVSCIATIHQRPHYWEEGLLIRLPPHAR